MGRRTQSEGEQWLTLQQAAAWLGVHPVTLRRWADNGQIACRLTAGRHRRFALSELERFAQAHLKAARDPSLPVIWAEAALQRARLRMSEAQPEAQWMVALDAERREQHRQIGQRLVGLTLQYLSAEDGEHLLDEARKLGEDYA
ncbi:MAG: helix-turn-helix domain-containing protein, partial [Thermoflexales bacterium]|nr:helix-turn-helix domain-containing protein [Thermoflexales bacterium]